MQNPKPKCSIITRQKHKDVGVFCRNFSVSANLITLSREDVGVTRVAGVRRG
jgi:hypothetical protein